jgi:hypothetical protein
MLRTMKDMEGYTIGATDGIIGEVRDFYFDDQVWVIRYLVVDTGEAPAHRKVLISPIAIGQPNWSEKVFPVALTRVQVKGSPDIDTNKPVSRQQEMAYAGYFGYGNYWGGGGLWGAGLYPDILQAGRQVKATDGGGHENHGHKGALKAKSGPVHWQGDLHLRSGNAVARYYVNASDGDIGHVEGFLVDERSWAIRYVIVNTSNWWLGHKVLIATQWIDYVSWAESKIDVNLTRQAIKDSPPYDAAMSFTPEHEAGIHAHYGRVGYWPRDAKDAETEAEEI